MFKEKDGTMQSLQRERQSALPGHVVLSRPGPSLDFTRRTEEAVVTACRVGEARRQRDEGDPSSLACLEGGA